MMDKKSPTIKDLAINKFKPQQVKIEKKDQSNMFPKDSIFTKVKTFINKKSGKEEELAADWRNINLSSTKIVLFKGMALSKDQLMKFSLDAQDFWLEEKKPSNK